MQLSVILAKSVGRKPMMSRIRGRIVAFKVGRKSRCCHPCARMIAGTYKYLNNMIEQDHRKVKQRCYPMLGFKTFGNAEVTLSGIEWANKIKKGQFDTSEITSPGAMILQVWEAVLAA